jgi:hypothetical protein
VRVELTEEGRRIVPKLLEASNEVNNQVFGGALGKVHAKALHKTLKEVSDHLTQASLDGDQNLKTWNKRR